MQNFSCWKEKKRNVVAGRLLKLPHNCTSFYLILLLPSFVLAFSHSFVFYFLTAFHTPEYIRPLTFYVSYFPQTPPSVCTNLSKLNVLYLYFLSVNLGTLNVPQNTFSSRHFHCAASIYRRITHNEI